MPDCFDTVTSALDPSLGIPVVCLVDDENVVRRALAEREVLGRVVAGRAYKLIADEPGIGVRTVEVHRARIFEKMDVDSAVELANPLRLAGGRDAG